MRQARVPARATVDGAAPSAVILRDPRSSRGQAMRRDAHGPRPPFQIGRVVAAGRAKRGRTADAALRQLEPRLTLGPHPPRPSLRPLRHPYTPSVIPAPRPSFPHPSVIPAPPPSSLRPFRHSCAGRNPCDHRTPVHAPGPRRPTEALGSAATRSGFRSDGAPSNVAVPLASPQNAWIPACAGMTGRG